MMYVDYVFYSTVYKGKAKEEDFTTLEIKASGILNYYTFNRIQEVTQNIKFAICELIDNIQDYEEREGKEITSEKVGTYSVSYSDKNNISNIREQKNIINKWLPSELTYRGVNYVYER